MAGASVNQVHLANAALVLLKGGNLFRLRRPHQHRAIAVRPSSVVRGVAKIFHPISRELRFTACGDVAHPQVEIANERGALSIGRENVHGRPATTGAWTLTAT